MANMQQLSLWSEPPALDSAQLPAVVPDSPAAESGKAGHPQSPANPNMTPLEASEPAARPPAAIGNFVAPPTFRPLESAIEAGVFGITSAGPMVPDEHEIAALTQEHANELVGTLVEVEALQDALRSGADPRTGRMPRTAEAAQKAADRWRGELQQLQTNYANMLAAFEEGFGPQASMELDAWVRGQVAGTPRRLPYDPGHPWHYYWAGNGAEPLTFDEIPPAEDAGRWLERDLPKNPAKRLARMRELLTAETQRLAEDRRRYEEIVARGAQALSHFDREIAYGGNDELARASTIALKYNHIRMGLGRVRWLRDQVDRERRWEPIHAALRNYPA